MQFRIYTKRCCPDIIEESSLIEPYTDYHAYVALIAWAVVPIVGVHRKEPAPISTTYTGEFSAYTIRVHFLWTFWGDDTNDYEQLDTPYRKEHSYLVSQACACNIRRTLKLTVT